MAPDSHERPFRLQAMRDPRPLQGRRWIPQEEADAYFKSPAWHDREARVLGRDNDWCKACERRPATQVHHLTYARFGNEPLFDLVAVCRYCHRRLHPDRSIDDRPAA